MVPAVRAKLLLLAAVALTLALTGCGSGGTAIPRLGFRTLDQGYAYLRSKGFRVSVAYHHSRSLPVSSLETLAIGRVFPAPGTRVAVGSVVTLFPEIDLVRPPTGALHATYFRIPNFTGRPAGVAMRWAIQHAILWNIPDLPPLGDSPARSLYDAYVVTAQQPEAGRFINATGWLTLSVKPLISPRPSA